MKAFGSSTRNKQQQPQQQQTKHKPLRAAAIRSKAVPTETIQPDADVSVDIFIGDDGGQDEPALLPTATTKHVYNPHRILHVIVSINCAILAALCVAFVVDMATRQPATALATVSRSRGVMHYQVVFRFTVDNETYLQLPAEQFDSQRLVDYHVCCSTMDEQIMCSNHDITLSNAGVARVRIKRLAVAGETEMSCKFVWSQQ
jgi:hypothetical protein